MNHEANTATDSTNIYEDEEDLKLPRINLNEIFASQMKKSGSIINSPLGSLNLEREII
jgi:hypothetical protein